MFFFSWQIFGQIFILSVGQLLGLEAFKNQKNLTRWQNCKGLKGILKSKPMEIQHNAICLVQEKPNLLIQSILPDNTKSPIRKSKATYKGHSMFYCSPNESCGNRDNYCLKVRQQKVEQSQLSQMKQRFINQNRQDISACLTHKRKTIIAFYFASCDVFNVMFWHIKPILRSSNYNLYLTKTKTKNPKQKQKKREREIGREKWKKPYLYQRSHSEKVSYLKNL